MAGAGRPHCPGSPSLQPMPPPSLLSRTGTVADVSARPIYPTGEAGLLAAAFGDTRATIATAMQSEMRPSCLDCLARPFIYRPRLYDWDGRGLRQQDFYFSFWPLHFDRTTTAQYRWRQLGGSARYPDMAIRARTPGPQHGLFDRTPEGTQLGHSALDHKTAELSARIRRIELNYTD